MSLEVIYIEPASFIEVHSVFYNNIIHKNVDEKTVKMLEYAKNT